MSDLHSNAVQLRVNVGTAALLHVIRFHLAYSLNVQRSQIRGFGGTTAGDPAAVAVETGQQPLHQFIVTTPLAKWKSLTAGFRLAIQSGTGYTPMIAADINGDGLANDRAFIPAPAALSDTTYGREFRTLLADAPGTARACLIAQLGRIAGANSCRGPWEARLDLTTEWGNPGTPGSRRLTFTAKLLNAGGALARLLGVSSNVVQSSALPDPRFAFVQSFDPTTDEFHYEINPSFGQPFNGASGGHQYPPFELQVGVQYRLGGAPPNPWLASHGLDPRRKAPFTATEVRAGLATLLRSPLDTILRLRDTLQLTARQVDALQAASARFHATVDTAAQGLITYVQARGRRNNDPDFIQRQALALLAINPARDEAARDIGAILTAAQRSLLAVVRPSLQ